MNWNLNRVTMLDIEEVNMADTAAATEQSPSKAKQTRSPASPFISLKPAIERARAFWDKEKHHPALIAHAATHWGYKPKSSGGLQTIGALKQFGLLEDDGRGEQRKVKITDLGRRIILDERTDSPERQAAIREAALKPKLHADLWQQWGSSMPSEPNMKATLTLDLGFTPGGADEFIRQFKDTVEFAKLGASDIVSPAAEDTDAEEQPMDPNTAGTPPMTEKRQPGGIPPPAPAPSAETEHFRIGPDSWVVVQFKGPVDQRAIKKLIRHYEENMDLYPGVE